MVLPTIAQDSTSTPDPEATEDVNPSFVGRAVITVESAFIRVLPLRESEAVASVFERDVLEVIGRNMDGLWFEVRRPNRMFNLGWINAELLDYDFAPETLPMTDGVTGLVGETAIPENNIAVFLTKEANMRLRPLLSSDIIGLIPLGAVVPATGRNSDGSWLFVNYRGNEGWINSSVFRRPPNILDLPDLTFIPDPDVPQLAANIIPPDIQLSQLYAFRDFVQISFGVAFELRPFWEEVASGEIMPCGNPPDFVIPYLITRDDVRELPELNRYVPRYNEGVQLLNEAIEPLYICGVILPDIVDEARNDAVNARIIMGSTLFTVNELEIWIRETNNLDPLATLTPLSTTTPSP
jgi:SH3 domain-containing protein